VHTTLSIPAKPIALGTGPAFKEKKMDDTTELIQHMQTSLGRLQMQYSEKALEFWALRLAWETLRLTWYIAAQHDDGGKLELVEGALKDLKERLQKGTFTNEKVG
jgi:hypothetical protein